jgi:hypothetical protein
MLVTINCNPASANNYQTIWINLMQAIKTVATAGAGTTPSLNALSSSTARSSTNMITVIDNTEAGGWTVAAGDNIPSTGASSPYYDTSLASPYILNLYNSNTSSTTYPYQQVVMSSGLIGGGYNSFTSYFNSYYWGYLYYGATTTNTRTTSNFTGGANPAVQLAIRADESSAYYGAMYLPYYNNITVMMAVTQDYMHIVGPKFVISMGLRETQSWEANYNDNPPVCGFAVDCSIHASSAAYPAASFAWMRSINNSGGWNTPYCYGQYQSSNSGSVNTVTGQGGTYSNAYGTLEAIRSYSPGTTYGRILALPLFMMTAHEWSGSYPVMYPPVTDSSTGALVPPAIPIVFSSSVNNAFNPGGRIKGIYKSLSNGTQYTITNFYTSNQTYVVNGDNYYPFLSGNGSYDLFLLRRA